MNLAVALALLRGSLAGNRTRLALTVLTLAIGVALAGAVHTIHASALAEIDAAARAVAGTADLEIRGPRNGFDDALFAPLARRPGVAVASPVLELDATVAGGGSLRVVGIDPFRASRLQPGFVADRAATGAGRAPAILDPESAFLTPAALARWKLFPGAALALVSGSGTVELRVAGALPALEAGGELAVIDIAAAQRRFARTGLLTRIDIRLKPGLDPVAFRQSLAAELPAGIVVSAPASASGRAADLTRAYRVNLNALAAVALLTGAFLVFSTLSLQAARRRQELALLRALGLTRRALAALLALEGALVGAAGAALGTVLGLAAGRAALAGFGSDLGAGYFRDLGSTFAPDALALAAIAAGAILTAAAGALLVARAAGRIDIAEALRDRALDLPAAGSRGVLPALACVALGGLCLLAPPAGGLPLGGYAAIGFWLAAAVLLVGPACRALLERLAPGEDAVAALALAQVRHLPGHLAASVAGIVVSASLCVAMAIMVYSFRASLDEWLRGVVGADLYARSAMAGDTAYFSPEEQRRIAALPGVARMEALRYERVVLDDGAPPLTVVARPLDARILRGFQAVPAEGRAPPGTIPVWITEAAADLHHWHPGERITLPLAGAAHPAWVAGVVRDYARTWGAILVAPEDFRRLTGDERANDLALHLAPGADPQAVGAALRAALPGAKALTIEDAAGIHRRSLAIFDRTFAATYALEAAAIFIGLAGVTSSFAALAWSRRREFGVLRYLGLTRREVLRLLALEGAAAGALGVALGLASGVAVSLVLIHVVNRQSFHWGMEVHWPWAGLAALAAAIVALCALGARWSGAQAVRDEAVLAVKNDA